MESPSLGSFASPRNGGDDSDIAIALINVHCRRGRVPDMLRAYRKPMTREHAMERDTPKPNRTANTEETAAPAARRSLRFDAPAPRAATRPPWFYVVRVDGRDK